MTLDEILTEYEGLWRQAALEGRDQYPAQDGGGNYGGCAWECPHHLGRTELLHQHQGLDWTCPECRRRLHSFMDVLIHLNDNHHWTWDMLANKTRDVLQQGGVTL